MDFPLTVEDEVYYCGFNSAKSYGGNSYFVRRPEGNWLIDSPRFTAHLVRRFREMGGIRCIFLTHRDDVADARAYAGEFGSTRFIHRKELAAQPDAEQVMEGFDPIRLAPDFLTIPTPGHTPGHCVLLYRGAFLFTGESSLVEPRTTGALGIARSLLAFVAATDRVDGETRPIPVRLGPARPRTAGQVAAGRIARATGSARATHAPSLKTK